MVYGCPSTPPWKKGTINDNNDSNFIPTWIIKIFNFCEKQTAVPFAHTPTREGGGQGAKNESSPWRGRNPRESSEPGTILIMIFHFPDGVGCCGGSYFLLLKMVPQCQGERDSFRDAVGGDYVRRAKFRHRNVWFCGRRDGQIVCENEMHPLELGLRVRGPVVQGGKLF